MSFKKTKIARRPIMQMACEDPGIERLTTLIVDRILEYCPTSVESLILPLATDPPFHSILDGLHIAMCKEPAALLQLLHAKETTFTVANKTTTATTTSTTLARACLRTALCPEARWTNSSSYAWMSLSVKG